ncbi:hypothetical protein [Geofilum rubicundum]|nr:hypothetical protein [Geofilum rubicundum]
MKTIGILALLTVITVISIYAKSSNDNKEKIGKNFKNISHYGQRDFINMDLGVIGYFPSNTDWENIDKKMEIIPLDSLRYIDSLDIKKIADTLYIKVYSQNHVYQSQNVYSIAENSNTSTDTLMIFNINFNLEMKDIISDSETFRAKDFTTNYIVKYNIDEMDKRIIIDKNFR